MSKIINFWNKLLRSDTFLKVTSIVIAIIVWFWVISIAKPSNEKDFSKIPVQIVFEGSTPAKNELMMKIVDNQFFVNAVIEGPRSNLLTLTEEKITASFDFSKVAAPGAANVPIEITLDDKNLSVKDYSPKYVTMEFAKEYTKTFNIEITPKGSLPEGYIATSQSTELQTITIKGPQEEVHSIKTVKVSPDLTDKTGTFTSLCEIEILDENNDSIDRTYLTIERTSITATIELENQRLTPFKVNIFDPNGVNITGKTNISFNPSGVLLQSTREKIDLITEILLTDIRLTEPLTESKVITIKNLPALPTGVKYTSTPTISVTLTPIPEG